MTAVLIRKPVITISELDELIREGDEDIVILDVRQSRAGEDQDRADFVTAHIPGAQLVLGRRDLAGPSSGSGGLFPLPSLEVLQARVTDWGINPESTVVVYSDTAHGYAGRAWVVLRWLGARQVRYLDGGLNAWQEAGYELESGHGSVRRGGRLRVSEGNYPLLDAESATATAKTGILIDSRSVEAFFGKPNDPRTGHIPRAVSLPTSEAVSSDGRIVDSRSLARRLGDIGAGTATEVGAYCGGGVSSALLAVALAEVTGRATAVYIGSWSDWVSDESRPVEKAEIDR